MNKIKWKKKEGKKKIDYIIQPQVLKPIYSILNAYQINESKYTKENINE